MAGLLPVDEAIRRIVSGVAGPTPAEEILVDQAAGRTLAAPLIATRTQPPFPASAMDGYAVRASDLSPRTPLRLVGESAAGRGFSGRIEAGETVRIFTGAPVPEGADTILIQEIAQVDGPLITPTQAEAAGRFVRPAGTDFQEGQTFFAAGYRLHAKDMALAASLGPGTVSVRRPPRVAILATGDELVLPGMRPGPDQIVAANHLSVMAIADRAGATAKFLGIAADTLESLGAHIQSARDWQADILVTMGGASVGAHDLVQDALLAAGMTLDFWKIAMRPGKPLMVGGLGPMRVLGLPGNPASSVVCAEVFLRPLIAALLGRPDAVVQPLRKGRLGAALPVNDQRLEYMRATLAYAEDGVPILTPHTRQDSSLTSVLATADALVVRPAFAPEASPGDPCHYLLLTPP